MNDINFWEMIWRTTSSFLILLFLARILGKKQISQLTFFHYITGITIGSIASEIASQKETPYFDGIISLIWWAVLTILMTYLSQLSPKIRLLLDDEPTIIIKDGKISLKSLKSLRMNMDEVMMLLREQSIFSIDDVLFAVLETNGELSVFKKPSEQNATKQDVKADVSLPTFMPTEIISDGKLLVKNLKELNLDEEWVMKKLRKQGVQLIEEVYFAQLQTNGSLSVNLKDNGL
ncbi:MULTISPECIES: YetF domain-containing protein [unclassified Psychrobacillus]|uniref:YetF domain-containing protein n=1 Tax=unclassified Psychrobacillus TaxID=2636677 RepID=UPI001E650C59